TMMARPAAAVALTSNCRKRSSYPSPRSPRIVSLRPPNRNTAPNAHMIASDTSPRIGSPPIHWVASITPPSVAAKSGRNHFVLRILIEDLLHGSSEESGHRQL